MSFFHGACRLDQSSKYTTNMKKKGEVSFFLSAHVLDYIMLYNL